MSDININLDGVIAFIAATVLSLLFLLGLLTFFIYGRARARPKSGRFIHQTALPHTFGLSLCLAGSIIIILLVVLTDRAARPHTLNIWLDKLVWLWAPVIFLLWPLGVYIRKRFMGKRLHQNPGEI
jgi:UDP-N-acetylmuramyl pentapeptide phosphotransferase/UDP-N-acetylglucosamine-1-phosphate transferase